MQSEFVLNSQSVRFDPQRLKVRKHTLRFCFQKKILKSLFHSNLLAPQLRKTSAPICKLKTGPDCMLRGNKIAHLKKNFFVNSGRFTILVVFSHDVTAAILVSQNNETAAMLVPQTNLIGVDPFLM